MCSTSCSTSGGAPTRATLKLIGSFSGPMGRLRGRNGPTVATAGVTMAAPTLALVVPPVALGAPSVEGMSILRYGKRVCALLFSAQMPNHSRRRCTSWRDHGATPLSAVLHQRNDALQRSLKGAYHITIIFMETITIDGFYVWNGGTYITHLSDVCTSSLCAYECWVCVCVCVSKLFDVTDMFSGFRYNFG